MQIPSLNNAINHCPGATGGLTMKAGYCCVWVPVGLCAWRHRSAAWKEIVNWRLLAWWTHSLCFLAINPSKGRAGCCLTLHSTRSGWVKAQIIQWTWGFGLGLEQFCLSLLWGGVFPLIPVQVPGVCHCSAGNQEFPFDLCLCTDTCTQNSACALSFSNWLKAVVLNINRRELEKSFYGFLQWWTKAQNK